MSLLFSGAGVLALAMSGLAQLAEVYEESGRVFLANDSMVVALGKAQKGGVISVIDRRSGRELVASQPFPRLFTLVVTRRDSDGQERTYLSSTDAASVDFRVIGREKERVVELRFHDIGGRGVECLCRAAVRRGDACIRWRMEEVVVPEGWVLEDVQFPFLVLRSPLEAGRDDSAVVGHTKGGVHRRPSAWQLKTTASAGQPGSMAAQFGCYYDDRGGIYTAAEDAKGYPKNLWLRRTQEGIELGWGHQCFASGTFRLDYEVVTTTFSAPESEAPTDWRHAADLYKAWAVKQPWCAKRFAERNDVPAWLKSGPAMVRFNRAWLGEPELIENWLNEYWRKHLRPNTPLITAFWGWEKVQTWVTPDYFPLFPSDEAFRRVAELSRRAGGHVFLWPSGYHYTLTYGQREDGTFEWDDRDRFAREAEPHAIINRDGTLWRMKASWLRGGETACLCPGDPWTVDWLNRIAEQLVVRGAEIIQIDQVVGGRFPPCYSTKHGHPPGPGLWMTEAFRKQLETMLQRCRKINPQAVVCFEEPNEHFIQQVFLQDYRDLEAPWSGPAPERASVFNYLYHEYLPTFQSNPRGGALRTQAYCLVNGQIPHFVATPQLGPGPLLDNGDFERWKGDVPAGWERVTGWQGQVWNGRSFRDDQEKHSGEISLRLECTQGDTVQISRNLAVGRSLRPGGRYRLSVWMRSGELAQPNRILIGALTTDLRSKGGWSLPMPGQEEGWVQRDTAFVVPPGTDFVRIMLHLSGQGVVWIDDMMLQEVGDDGTLHEVMRPEVPEDHDLMHHWVELFADEGRPYLLHGTMLHPPKLEVAGASKPSDGLPAVLHNAFRAPGGNEAVIVVNATGEQQAAHIWWRRRSVSLELNPWEARIVR